MRPSNRSKILDAAVRVVDRDGITGVTFDAVSVESGITRGGMLYHFPSRDALLQGIHQHLADQWEASLENTAGKPMKSTNPEERAVAYARTALRSATRSELLFLLQSSTNLEFNAPWEGVIDRWAPAAPSDVNDPASLARFVARLAADGLWVYESLSSRPLTPEIRQAVAEHLAGVMGPSLSSQKNCAFKDDPYAPEN